MSIHLLGGRPYCGVRRYAAISAALLVLTLPGLADAHPGRGGGWGGGSWGRDTWDGGMLRGRGPDPARSGPPEDRVTVSTFVTDEEPAAASLRQGTIAVTGAPTGSGVDSGELAVYAAAVVDQLAQAGYRTDVPESTTGQVTELHISHATLQPEEVRKPVSGAMAVGVSNRGTATALALNIDLSKPRSALISTTLEARIRDRASGKVLWEGRADIATRAGDDRWSSGAIANRLAAALFYRFPDRSAPPT